MEEHEIELYSLIATSRRYKKLLEDTNLIIQKALEIDGNWAISFSGGKDSTVLLDLLIKNNWRGKGVYFYYSKFENPEENDKQVEWANSFDHVDIIKKKCFGSYDAWVNAGYFFNTATTQEEHFLIDKVKGGFKKASDNFRKEEKADHFFTGMTMEESRARKINSLVRGHTYYTKSREGYTSNPLYKWTGEDIWAYIVTNQLPYLSVYDIPHFKRETIRNELTVLYSDKLALNGMFVQYRSAYPSLFRQLAKEFPEVKNYV